MGRRWNMTAEKTSVKNQSRFSYFDLHLQGGLGYYAISTVNSQCQTLHVPIYNPFGTDCQCSYQLIRQLSNYVFFTQKYYILPGLCGSLVKGQYVGFLCRPYFFKAFPSYFLAWASHQQILTRHSDVSHFPLYINPCCLTSTFVNDRLHRPSLQSLPCKHAPFPISLV